MTLDETRYLACSSPKVNLYWIMTGTIFSHKYAFMCMFAVSNFVNLLQKQYRNHKLQSDEFSDMRLDATTQI